MITTGGTGLTPSDLTPEMTQLVIDRPVPGIAEAIRSHGVSQGHPGEPVTASPYWLPY